jgi:peptide/nickel transport system substrate-binding protein
VDSLPQQLKKVFKKSRHLLLGFFSHFLKNTYLKKYLQNQERAKVDADKNLVYSLAASKIPRREQFKYLFKFLDPREKIVFKIAILVLLSSLSYLAIGFYNKNLITLPKSGGVYREGSASYPQSINPLYAPARDIDLDLARLIYSSLFNYDETGRLQNDLIDSWQVSADGKEYSFKLKENVKWHNGNILTTEDVVFTFNLIKNPDFRSPLKASLNGINIEKIDDLNFRLILAEPYADVLHLLTFGIMPKFAWESVIAEAAIISELNLKPVGSGPYQWESLVKSKGGEMKEYHLVANSDYYGPKSYIDKIIFKFFPDYNQVLRALNSNEIEGASYLPEDLLGDVLARHSLNFHYLQLPQINSVFFNQAKNDFLKEIKVRQALNYAIDREQLFNSLLSLGETRVDGPILAPDFTKDFGQEAYNLDLEKARELLKEAGFKNIVSTEADFEAEEISAELVAIKNYAEEKNLDKTGSWWLSSNNLVLQFKLLASLNAKNELLSLLQNNWEDLGVRVFIEQVSNESLLNKLGENDFELLFYGQAVDMDPDIAAFWHSSQIGSGTLNVTAYKNEEVDALLIEARQIANFDERLQKYNKIQELINRDLPVIFLYSPSYIYVQDKKVRGFSASLISTPSDRLANVNNWYMRTKKRFSW